MLGNKFLSKSKLFGGGPSYVALRITFASLFSGRISSQARYLDNRKNPASARDIQLTSSVREYDESDDCRNNRMS